MSDFHEGGCIVNGLLARFVISAVALYLTTLLAQSLNIGIEVQDTWRLVLAVVVLGVFNALIRPLVLVLTLPLNCLTLGIFTFVINALMFWLAGALVPGFTVDGPLAALFGSVMMGVISGLANRLIGTERRRR